MSEPLTWAPPPPPAPQGYSVHALGYSVCRVWVNGRWTFECWLGHEQLAVGLARAYEAKAWCQQHHDAQQVAA